MSRKDYEAVAKILRTEIGAAENYGEIKYKALKNVAHELAVHFAADNPRFDREKFLFAAGVAL